MENKVYFFVVELCDPDAKINQPCVSLNLYAQKITGAVTDEEGKPFQNYTLKVVGASKADTLQVYSPDGRFAFEGRDCPYRFMIEYFGE